MLASTFEWFATSLHPSQSLLSIIKEPQYNYLEVQKFIQRAKSLSAALLVDLAKAFERVNIPWLLRLLHHYHAPKWLIAYFSWTLSKRTTTPKIRGHLTASLIPVVGLDMGRACSVLLFCLSIDPLLRRLHILCLKVQRAYMDDTTLAKAGSAWIRPAQETFLLYEPVGVAVEQHSCCLITSHPLTSTTKRTGFPTWKQAALHALQHPPSTAEHYYISNTTLTLVTQDLLLLANAAHPTLLSYLIHLPCACKAKTTIVPSHQPTPNDFCTLDDTPFGMRVLKNQDITLGLPLVSKHRNIFPIDRGGKSLAPGRIKLSLLLQDALAKATLKLTQRANRIQATLTSLPKGALFWTAYCQSTLYYVASVFTLPAKQFKKLQRLQQKVLLGRAWIPGNLLSDVLSAFKIGPCQNLRTATDVSMLGAALRLYGSENLIQPAANSTFN
jgi:hypothetical protein